MKLTICFSLISPNGDFQAPAAPGTLNGHLSQDTSEGPDARFVPSDLRLTSLTLRLLFRSNGVLSAADFTALMKRIKLQKNGNVADVDLTVLRAHFAAGGQFTIEMSVVSCTEETRATTRANRAQSTAHH